MPSKKPKKQKPKKKLTTFSTPSDGAPVEIKKDGSFTPAPEAAAGVSADQPQNDGLAELKKLEKELSEKPGAGAKPAEPDKGEGSEAPESTAPRRRRKFKRPPPENTIRMTIRQYWRFRVWVANKKLQLPPDLIGAVLEGTNETLVEPLVEPVIGIIDEYVPEEWISFIEERSPILTFLIALFEAEQTFSQKVQDIAREIKKEPAKPVGGGAPPPSRPSYPKPGEV